ncbi:L-type lectin-domain containing receptor kinase VII.1, partial [Linum perenne]
VVDFIFNRFSSTANSTNDLLLYGSATVKSQILTLTNSTTFTIGRGLFLQRSAPNLKTPPMSIPSQFPSYRHGSVQGDLARLPIDLPLLPVH